MITQRVFGVSLAYLEIEEDCFSRYNVDSLSGLLRLATNILETYCGILSRLSAKDSERALWHSMAAVLRMALGAVACAVELCEYQERSMA